MENNNRFISIIEKAYNSNRYYVTDFLSTNEQSTMRSLIKKYPSMHLEFNGGISDAEYLKCAIIPNDYIGDIDFGIDVFEILYNKRYLEISHRNILGTIMSLGIVRNRLGDIIINDDKAYFAICSKLSDFITLNFKVINHKSIELRKTYEKIDFFKEGKNKTIFIASNRLDNFIASGFDISRSKALDLITHEFVKVNQKVELKSFQKLNKCDIISVKSYGRLEIVDFKGESRGNNLIYDIIVYR